MTLKFDPEAFHKQAQESIKETEQNLMIIREGNVMADKTYFVGFNGWDKDANRPTMVSHYSDEIRKTGTTDKGGTWTRLSFTILIGGLENAVDGKTLRKTEDGHYEVHCGVRYSKKDGKKRNAIEFLKQVRQNNELAPNEYVLELANTFINDEGKEITNFWHRISPSQFIDVNMMTFRPRDLQIFTDTDADGVLRLQQYVPILLDGLKGEIYISAYETPKKIINEEGEEVESKDEMVVGAVKRFSLGCSSLTIAGNEELSVTASDRLNTIFPKNERPCVPHADLKSGKKEMPMLSYFYISQRLDFDGWLYRACYPLTNRSNYVAKEDSAEGPMILHTFIVKDAYQMDDHFENYEIKFKMYSQQCQSFGIDMNPDVWVPIQMTHIIDGHMLGSFWQKQTNALRANQTTSSTGEEVDGSYVFFTKGWVPDYKSYLPKAGIKITRERFFKEFEAKPKPKKGADDRTYMVLKDGDDEQHKFISKLGYDNPLHALGVKSPVINFGTLERPMFSCADASSVLFSDTTTFYALVSVPPSKIHQQFPGLEGDELFDATLEIEEVAYQIFAVQNLTNKGHSVTAGKTKGRGKKKGKK